MTYPHRILFCFWSLIFISVALAGRTKQAGPSAKDLALLDAFRSQRDIVYKTVNGESLDMVLFLPEAPPKGKMPVMLYTHGGGWGGGDKFKVFRAPFQEALRELLANGVAVASIEYRLTRKGVSTAVDCVTDCKDAARFLIKHAERYQLDPSRIGVWGGSAGGHLSLMTGMADNALFPGDEALAKFEPEFRCIVSYYPAVSFLKPELSKGSNFEKPQRLVPMIGGLLEEKRETAALISPSEHLTNAVPPTLLLHGDQDTVLPIDHSHYFLERAEEVGADVRLITVKNGGHSFSGKEIKPSMQEINHSAADFILKHL
ncbi:prolyl oligopeptidase family serine peptidase [Pelagicoccus mobilis]|uniref:Prolyl oligopeptidase family serine peptidase n=1 Tax=Pelagicoccus mobilis TaxID=415221 RepID=A0A934S1S2_9BACT|nr:prolyl oligopeptidase family serine peptidase [Pelagicoccus mobilis]MBK1879031.1 prolyl oligopeptidase family serine peptidase [Pelagicoccus mobilis]